MRMSAWAALTPKQHNRKNGTNGINPTTVSLVATVPVITAAHTAISTAPTAAHSPAFVMATHRQRHPLLRCACMQRV